MRARLVAAGVLALVYTTTPALALQRHWTGSVSNDWFTAGNWANNGVPGTASGDSPRMGINASWVNPPNGWPVYNGDNSNMPFPQTGAFLIGGAADATFTMQSGLLIHESWVNLGRDPNVTGTWIHNGGTFTNRDPSYKDFTVGLNKDCKGVLIMNGGLLRVGQFRTSFNDNDLVPGGSGTVTMTGGEIRANTINLAYANDGTVTVSGGLLVANNTLRFNRAQMDGLLTMTISGTGEVRAPAIDCYKSNVTLETGGTLRATGAMTLRSGNLIDFKGGHLYLAGDQRSQVVAWLAAGRLTTSLPDHEVVFTYDSLTGETDVSAGPAVPHPVAIQIEGTGYKRSVQLTRWTEDSTIPDNQGGTLHVFVRNTGQELVYPVSVTVNGETVPVGVSSEVPVASGNIAWARVWPSAVAPGQLCTVTVGSASSALGEGASANIEVKTLYNATATTSTVLTTSGLRIGSVVASPDMRKLNVYLRNLDTVSYNVTGVRLNEDVTSACTFLGGTTIGPRRVGIIEVAYASPVPVLTPLAIRIQAVRNGADAVESASFCRVLAPRYPIGTYNSGMRDLENGQKYARKLLLDLNTGEANDQPDLSYMAEKYFIQNWNGAQGGNDPARAAWVRTKATSRDLFAYYAVGEPEYDVTETPAAINWRNQYYYWPNDPFHSTFLENAVTKAFGLYAPTVDTPSMDHYVMYAPNSIEGTGITRTAEMWEAVEYNDQLKLNAEPLQTWPWTQLCLSDWPRQPMPFGVNQQFWITAMCGAKGIFWFRYASDAVPEDSYEVRYPDQMAEALTVTREFSQVRSLLLYGETIDNVTVSDANLLAARAIVGPEAMVLVVVNMNSTCPLSPAYSDYTLTDTAGTASVPIPSWISPTSIYEVTESGAAAANVAVNGQTATFSFTVHDTRIFVIGKPDTTAPQAPLNLNVAEMVTANEYTLSWKEPFDNVGVLGYKVYRNGTEIGDVAYPLFVDPAGVPGAIYTVGAYDTAGNLSPDSLPARLGLYAFNNPDYFEVWIPSQQISGLSWVNGRMAFQSTGDDPVLVGPRSLRLNPNSLKRLRIGLRNGTPGTTARFYWTTPFDATYTEDKSVQIPIVAGDTSTREYQAELFQSAQWNSAGEITSLRLDPADAAGPIEIDYIEFTGARFDIDLDGDVDDLDMDAFIACARGPGIAVTDAGCRAGFDTDGDGDIDSADFGPFQNCLTGEGRPAVCD